MALRVFLDGLLSLTMASRMCAQRVGGELLNGKIQLHRQLGEDALPR